jgi:hypothetical protein
MIECTNRELTFKEQEQGCPEFAKATFFYKCLWLKYDRFCTSPKAKIEAMKTIVVAIILFFVSPISAGEVTVQWDVSAKADGYRLYYGSASRADSLLDPVAITKKLYEKYCGTDTVCIDSWKNYCKDDDKLCDKDFFQYEHEIEMPDRLVTEHTIKNLEPGKYYFSITNYEETGDVTIISTNQRESKYTDELMGEVLFEKPSAPKIVSPLEYYEIPKNYQEFCWETSDIRINYWTIWIGTGTEGESRRDIYLKGFIQDGYCKTVGPLPLNGEFLYVLLWWESEGAWYVGDATKYRTKDKTAPALPRGFKAIGR